MAMNAAVLSAQMTAAVLAAVESDYLNIADDHKLSGFTTAIFWGKIAAAISSTVISHIQANAKCTGFDSSGDSHNAVGIA
jgi:hypothetical protein